MRGGKIGKHFSAKPGLRAETGEAPGAKVRLAPHSFLNLPGECYGQQSFAIPEHV